MVAGSCVACNIMENKNKPTPTATEEPTILTPIERIMKLESLVSQLQREIANLTSRLQSLEKGL